MKLEKFVLGARVVSGKSIVSLVDDLSRFMLEFVKKSFKVNANNFEELDEWLIKTELSDEGVTGQIRSFVKNSDQVKKMLSDSSLLTDLSLQEKSELILHDVIRLRTVVSFADYTISRPHQDIALWEHDPHAINVWIPLVNIDESLSPIRIYESPKCVLDHFINEHGQLELRKELYQDLTSSIVTLSKGEALLFSPTQIHHATENKSNKIRWSIDFRLKDKA
jgi:ectoine hydroxylase-related dioxygenase (phytanoyl-CoA dioxygenase family)